MCHSHATGKKADGQSSKSNLPEVIELEIKAEFELRSVLTPNSVSQPPKLLKQIPNRIHNIQFQQILKKKFTTYLTDFILSIGT